jgi:hypothetical protein
MSLPFNCRIIFHVGIFVCLASVKSISQTYCENYFSECSYAKEFYRTHIVEFENSAKKTNESARFLFSIVAPELTQYSWLKDKIESVALKVLYVQKGKGYADFSIGYFQMKPSFIESLEAQIKSYKDTLKRFQEILIPEHDPMQARITRIKRLETLDWQIKYLEVFVKIVEMKFKFRSFRSTEDKVAFYASAYNVGFLKSEEVISKISEKQLFPFFAKQKFKYKDVSLFFYRDKY